MQCKSRGLTTASLAMAFIIALGCVSVMDASDADTVEYDKDLGRFWSYTVQFIFDGRDAESIIWDFGDGSEPSIEFDVQHEFPAKGVYTVTQTTVNTVGETVQHYKVEIMGFPQITLVYNNGSEDGTIHQDAYKVTAQRPVNPIREGYSFTGWFTDSKCTQAYDWNTPVTEPVTLYAGWGSVSGPTDGDDHGMYLYAMIVCIIVAALLVIATVFTGSVFLAVPTVIFSIASMFLGLIHGGVI